MSVSTNSYFPLGKLPIAVSSIVRVALLPSGITKAVLTRSYPGNVFIIDISDREDC